MVEDVDQRPIQGVIIDFNGIEQATTDSFGAFRDGLVPPRALDIITLTHDEYDRNVVVHQPYPGAAGDQARDVARVGHRERARDRAFGRAGSAGARTCA